MHQDTESLIREINQSLLKADGKYNQTKVLNSNKELLSEIMSATSFITWECKLSTRIWYILHNLQTVRKCCICGKELHDTEISLNQPAKVTCGAKECIYKKRVITLTDSYGPEYFQHWQLKVQETNLAKFGVANAMDSEDISAKQKDSVRAKVERDKDTILQKRVDTVFARYGVVNVGQLPDHTAKMQQTSIEKFGAISYSSTEECKSKVTNSWKNISPEKLAAIRKKAENTCLARYGVSNYSKTPAAQKKRRSLYEFCGMYFDSSYELSYFLWALYNNKTIERPSVTFEYLANGCIHTYIPDFIVDGELVEIKGAHFFNENGDLFNPFSKDLNEQEIYKQKGMCMKENGVKVITDGDTYRKWVDLTYGVDFCDSCKIKK